MAADPHPDGRARGTSLWLVPEPTAAGLLSTLIEGLSMPLGAPVFPPHVTLLGGLADSEDVVVERCRVVAESSSALTLTAIAVEHRAEFFRCVAMTLPLTPELGALSRAVRRAFGRWEAPPFEPHLSLVYGRFPSATREGLCDTAAQALTAPLRLDALEVWRTQGKASEWRRRASFALDVGKAGRRR